MRIFNCPIVVFFFHFFKGDFFSLSLLIVWIFAGKKTCWTIFCCFGVGLDIFDADFNQFSCKKLARNKLRQRWRGNYATLQQQKGFIPRSTCNGIKVPSKSCMLCQQDILDINFGRIGGKKSPPFAINRVLITRRLRKS